MKNAVTKQQIDELLKKSEFRIETVYNKVTMVSCKLPNGFVINEASGAVDPANYDENLAKKSVWKELKISCGNSKDMLSQNSFTMR